MLDKWRVFLGEPELAAGFDKSWSHTKHTRIEINIANSSSGGVIGGLPDDNNALEATNGGQKGHLAFKKYALCQGHHPYM